jgi:hypothetical protein
MSRFNQRNWNGLRTLLADEVKLHQRLLRVGRPDVGWFCTLYAKIDRALQRSRSPNLLLV